MAEEARRIAVREVHNFGGFFGGDTVTLTAVQVGAPDEEFTLTIDQQALANVRDRHTICAGMLLDLTLAGDRVDRAELLAAASHAELRAALGPAALDPRLEAAQILSFSCAACGLWVAGAPRDGRCPVCGAALGSA
ncbi:hypothetical protein [Kouleothrix sp.]|uniref:hypothetical protein n=1 Tax=Kouleothrix sp. TaxID=2779161 RepID=UPI00391D468A